MRERAPLLLLIATVAATAVVYRPLVSAYFFGDDFLHLFAIVDANLGEYLLRPHGGHLLLARNAVFVVFHQLFGMRAELYFWAVLLTHLLNACLLFRIVFNWTDSAALAAFGALLWAISPAHAGTLQWYSVYGQVLVGTILLAILHQVSRADRAGATLPNSILIGWPLLLITASTCFGVGIGVTMLSPLALYLLLPPSRVRFGVCAILVLIAALMPTIYKAVIVYHEGLVGTTSDQWAMAIAFGSLSYRLAILRMFAWLLSCGASNLLLTFAAPLVGFPSIPTYLATAAFALTTLTAVIIAPPHIRRRLLGLMVLAGGAYGIIAAGRATLLAVPKIVTSAAIPRYHYVGMIPLSILICCAIAQLTSRSRGARQWHTGLLSVAVLATGIFYSVSRPFVDTHLAARKETMAVVEQLHSTIDAVAAPGDVLIENRAFKSVGVWLNADRSGFPGWAGVFTLFFPANVVDGKRVRFVVKDEATRAAIGIGKRSRDLFVVGKPADAIPSGGKPASKS